MSIVSVIVPVYNAQKTLEKCLDALINQTYKDFEVICVDDGSQDSSFEILKQYAGKDSRFKVYTQENHGPAFTRHYAISQSNNSKYLMFCDADDWYEPDMIKEMVETIEKENVDIVMCDSNIINLSNNNMTDKAYEHYNNNLKLKGRIDFDFNKNAIEYINLTLWNKIFRKDIIEKNNIEYPTKYEHDDSIFFYKYILCCHTYYGLDKCLYNYIAGSASSIMGKLLNYTNKGKQFDFIFAWQDFWDYYIKTKQKKFVTNRFLNINFRNFKHFFNMLNMQDKQLAFNYIKEFISNNQILLLNKQFKKLYKINNLKEFDKYLMKEEVKFIEKIFSLKNMFIGENKKKVLTILGYRIILKNYKYTQN